jgi:hypothetical protein
VSGSGAGRHRADRAAAELAPGGRGAAHPGAPRGAAADRGRRQRPVEFTTCSSTLSCCFFIQKEKSNFLTLLQMQIDYLIVIKCGILLDDFSERMQITVHVINIF